ncbi:MAG: N-terminal phage integrase SAM-like domain-containing protein [Blautia marasmi]
MSIQWKAHIRYTVKESTYSNYEEILDNHILPLLGEMQVKKFTNHTIAGFIQNELEQGMAYGSIHVIISVLKNILRYAQEFGYFPAEPLNSPVSPQVAVIYRS